MKIGMRSGMANAASKRQENNAKKLWLTKEVISNSFT